MPPVTMLIKPASGLCNMRCEYCFYRDVAEHRDVKSYGIMNKDTLECLVQKALTFADGSCSFMFQGGEPTLAGLDFYETLMRLEKKHNIKNVKIFNTIQTNGYAVNEEWAEFFAKHGFLTGISIDGTRDLHDACRIDAQGKGTYSKTIKTARLFERYRVEYNILCVVNNFTARHGAQIYRALRKNGFRFMQFIPCLDPFDGAQNKYSLGADRYAEFLKSTFDCYFNDFRRGDYASIRTFDNYVNMLAGYPPESCGMSGVCSCYFVAEGDGSVYPCDFYVLDKWRMGNINENSFDEMRDSPQARMFEESSKYISPKCRECGWLNLCRGGCRRNREPFVGDKPSLNQYCTAYSAFFEYAYERMAFMARVASKK